MNGLQYLVKISIAILCIYKHRFSMFSIWNKLYICYRCNTMFVSLWYIYIQKWYLLTSLDSIDKQLLSRTRKIFLFNFATYKCHFHCDDIRISSDRNNNGFLYYTYLRNVQTYQVKFINTSGIVEDQYNYNRNSIYYIFTSKINKYIMLCIYSYRFERVMPTSTLQDINLINDFVIYRRIICAVDMHRKAMELVSV